MFHLVSQLTTLAAIYSGSPSVKVSTDIPVSTPLTQYCTCALLRYGYQFQKTYYALLTAALHHCNYWLVVPRFTPTHRYMN